MTGCNSGSGFPNAGSMVNMSTNWPVIWSEINMLQQAILSASSQCPYPCNGQGGTPGTGGAASVCISGGTPMTFVSGITSATVVNGGDGYYVDTPAVVFIPPYGVTISPSDIASATVVTNGNSITAINVLPGSAGYQPVVTTASINSLTGAGAVLSVITTASGEIFSIDVVTPGTGYTLFDTIFIDRALAPSVGFVDAVATITALDVSGGIQTISVNTPGTGYSPSTTTVEIRSSLNGSLLYPTGSGFQSTTVVNSTTGEITGVLITNGGFGYATLRPQMVVSDPGTGVSSIVVLDGALIVPPGNSVQSITIVSTGNNYTQSATATIVNPISAPSPSIPAQVTLNIPVNTYCTDPELYYAVWQGVVVNPGIRFQLDYVTSYFTNLGYSVKLGTNPNTGSSLEWCICWG